MHAALLAAEAEGATLGLPPVAVGLIGFGALVALLVVAYAFRSAGHKNR